MTATTKYCPKCGIEKPTSEFCKDRSKKDGLCITCRACRREHSARWRQDHPEKTREYSRRYLEDPEVRERKRRWHQAHPTVHEKHPRPAKIPADTKCCPGCGIDKPRSDFNRNRHNKDGFQVYCRDCQHEQKHRWYAENAEEERKRVSDWGKANPDKAREKRRRWFQAHREECLEQRRRYCEANPDKERERKRYWRAMYADQVREANRRWRAKHLQEAREAGRRWKKEHADQVRETNRHWCHAHRKQVSEYSLRWKKRYPEMNAALSRNRRARELAAPGSHTADDVKRQYESQQGLCFWCSEPLNGCYHADHVIPIMRGGSNSADNMVCTCARCNTSKQAKLPFVEWEPPDPLFDIAEIVAMVSVWQDSTPAS